MPGIPGFFDGDFRSVSKTRVALGGASRREQQDKKALLEQARKDREKRSQNRAEIRSASRIQVGAPPRDPESSLGTPLTFSPPAADHEPLTTPDHDDVPSTDSRRRGAPVATCNARGPASATSGARATAWIPWRGPQTRELHPTS